MKKFMDNNFMLNNDTAVKLYHDYAAHLPIYDYHCHLSPQIIYENIPFENIWQIMLDGDHYKWRYMRSNGIDEEYITGSKSAYEKFCAFCSCLQYAIGNPLYHWTHLELKKYFDIDETVTQHNCENIWNKCNQIIRDKKISPSYFINHSNVALICTTDNPIDTLEWHKKIAQKGHIKAKVLPTFRPDELLEIEKDTFTDYIKTLSSISGIQIKSYADLIKAVYDRIDYFHKAGCRISDHSFGDVPYNDSYDADTVFNKVMNGESIISDEAESYKCGILVKLAAKYNELNWAMQLHIGALRDNNSKMLNKIGSNTGFDSIADYSIAYKLSRLLDCMESSTGLPKTILYTLNPKDNYVLGTMIGNFQSAQCSGKIQFGSAWWFNDQRDGMTEHMKALANLGALNKFIGMLTDSRSFLSYSRHEYFRRILCNLIGQWVENGEFPCDYGILETIVKNISFNNAKDYFGIEI